MTNYEEEIVLFRDNLREDDAREIASEAIKKGVPFVICLDSKSPRYWEILMSPDSHRKMLELPIGVDAYLIYAPLFFKIKSCKHWLVGLGSSHDQKLSYEHRQEILRIVEIVAKKRTAVEVNNKKWIVFVAFLLLIFFPLIVG